MWRSLALSTFLAAALAAGDADLRQEFVRALAASPSLEAVQARALAARRAEGSAGRLADPMLTAGYARKSLPMGRVNPMYEIMLEQPLPRWGERDAMRAMAASGSAMAAAEARMLIGDLAADIAGGLAELDASRARQRQLEAQLHRSESLCQTVDARLASGNASAAERLLLDTRLGQERLALADARRAVADQESGLRARLGLPADQALPPFVAPGPTDILPERNPAFLVAEARRHEAEAQFKAARAQRLPETAIGLRGEREVAEDGDMDTIGVRLTVSLPIWQGASAANENAAQASQRAARREADAARHAATAAIARAARAAEQAAGAQTLAANTRKRLDAEENGLIAGAGTGQPLAMVLDLLDRIGEVETQAIEATSAARMATADLWRLAPPELPAEIQP